MYSLKGIDMKATFDACVTLLEWLAQILGMTYIEINVWLFCILLPIILATLITLNIMQSFLIIRLLKAKA